MDWILPQNATYSTFRCLQCITFNKSKKPNEYYSLLFPQSQLEVDVGQHLLSLLLKVLANRKMVNTNEDTIQEYYQMVEYCISILHQVEAHHLVLLFQQIEILATELKVDTLNWMNGIAGEVEFRKLLVHLISMIKNCSLCSKGDVKVASMRIRLGGTELHYAKAPSKDVMRNVKLKNETQSEKFLWELYRENTIDESEEKLRFDVVQQLQQKLKVFYQRQELSLIPFGSSMSKFGDKNSDLDMCLLTADYDETQYQKRGNLSQEMTIEDYIVEEERELEVRVRHLRKEYGKQLRQYTKTLAEVKAKDPLANTTALDQKIFMHSEKYGHFDRLMHVLDNKKRALNDQDNKGDRKNAKKKVNKPSRSKMYRLQNALSKAGASDFEMILHASVPIIKFQLNKHFCDICVDNPLPTYNTGLLRQYASLDQRVSPLAYAVKRWAKLNDIASSNMGSLSSYAYVLMVIHFLQQCKPAILPNLQDKTLSPKPMTCGDFDVAFCTDMTVASQILSEKNQHQTNISSVAQLLLDFFAYYENDFDMRKQVISIKNTEPMLGAKRWGDRNKPWRISIEDPFDINRDLGVVVNHNGQNRIEFHLKQAFTDLCQGISVSDLLSKPNEFFTKKEKATARSKRIGKKAQKRLAAAKGEEDAKKNCPNSNKAFPMQPQSRDKINKAKSRIRNRKAKGKPTTNEL